MAKVVIDHNSSAEHKQPKNASLEQRIIQAMRTVQDPEIPVNIYDLGLVYKTEIQDGGSVNIDMTLTTPNCPVADEIPRRVKAAVEKVSGVKTANINMVWEPRWTQDRMSDEVKLELGLF